MKNKSRIVKIEATSRENATLPIKFATPSNGRPTTSDFRFAPRSFGHLSEYVDEVMWDSVEKQLFFTIAETPKFDAMKWLNYLDEQYLQLQKSPFVDVDTNILVIDFLDNQNHKVATFRFKNLKVEKHECKLNRGVQDFLKYEVAISYQYVEMLVHADKATDDYTKATDKDAEWQTVELPA